MKILRVSAGVLLVSAFLLGSWPGMVHAHDGGGASFTQTGQASWYGPGFHGRKTASGEIFDQNRLTAAHRSLPLDSTVRVTNLDNGQSVEVQINDRGPHKPGRVIDLSKAAAERLDMIDDGVARVRIEAVPGEDTEVAGAD